MTRAGNDTPREVPRISLTFDDGPDPIWTPRVLGALQRVEARATFFVVTPLARRFPRVISNLLRYGHGVEFHCTEHVRHTEQSRKEVEADVRDGLRELHRQGVRPRFWRPPWGVLAPFTAEIAYAFGLELALWTEGTHDWRGDLASEILERVGPELRPGSVVLMHDGIGPGARRSGCGETVALVEGLVERIRFLGCEPGPLGTSFTVGTSSTNGASSELERSVGA
ncbi:MAG: polysaccharide deacetylase family protein [Actinomycetota bacterium]|nr:polysaccharide deacetylase family protein [Actinomycetota bacterium]